MLLPIGHEKMTVRRWPVVTIGIIVVTVLLHGLVSVGEAGREQRAMGAMLEARILYLQHPGLGICAPLKPYVGVAPLLPSLGGADDADPQDTAKQYETACAELAEATGGLAAVRFGYVPARANLAGLFTYVFVHADWWHVIGNMWFLFLCGLALEDRWGRLAFAFYYVAGGVVAAGVHHLLIGDPSASLIGASGAVAAAMGAFLVLFATTKIRFVGFFAFRIFSFEAPAYVMLPMWAAVEVLYALVASSSGTAHWAHAGGFLFGAALAGAFRVLGVDRRLDDRMERTVALGDDPRVDTARALVEKGESAQALAMLEGLAQEKKESIHVWQALRDAARAAGNAEAMERASTQVRRLTKG
jgi:membrane associated rhomboid family serine protease